MSALGKAFWGPACWTVLHTAAAKCDTQEACLGFVAFLEALLLMLPCPECREHLCSYCLKRPPRWWILDAESASRFVFDLHNFVNHETGKPQQTPDIVRELYGIALKPLTRVSTRNSRCRGTLRADKPYQVF